jgi:hypothetical protein
MEGRSSDRAGAGPAGMSTVSMMAEQSGERDRQLGVEAAIRIR